MRPPVKRPISPHSRKWSSSKLVMLMGFGALAICGIYLLFSSLRRAREQEPSPSVGLIERYIKPKGVPGLRVRLVWYQDTEWREENFVFVDLGDGPQFVSSMNETDEAFAKVLLSRDQKGIVVLSQNGQKFFGGYNFSLRQALNSDQAKRFVHLHGLGTDDVFLSGAPLNSRRPTRQELQKYLIQKSP